MATIAKDTISFLSKIEKNNNRPWFDKNKEIYKVALENVKDFQQALVTEMNKTDEIENHKIFRIYRDVRFSKDKTPYNSQFKLSMSRKKPFLRGGYFLAIGPKETFVAAGFWNPNPHDLKLIRGNIAVDDKPMRKIISAKKFKDTFETMDGEAVKTAPKGFSKDHNAIDLLRHKQFIVSKKYKTAQVTDAKFVKEVIKDYKAIRPFFNYMSEILTHNLNGEPLYK